MAPRLRFCCGDNSNDDEEIIPAREVPNVKDIDGEELNHDPYDSHLSKPQRHSTLFCCKFPCRTSDPHTAAGTTAQRAIPEPHGGTEERTEEAAAPANTMKSREAELSLQVAQFLHKAYIGIHVAWCGSEDSLDRVLRGRRKRSIPSLSNDGGRVASTGNGDSDYRSSRTGRVYRSAYATPTASVRSSSRKLFMSTSQKRAVFRVDKYLTNFSISATAYVLECALDEVTRVVRAGVVPSHLPPETVDTTVVVEVTTQEVRNFSVGGNTRIAASSRPPPSRRNVPVRSSGADGLATSSSPLAGRRSRTTNRSTPGSRAASPATHRPNMDNGSGANATLFSRNLESLRVYNHLHNSPVFVDEALHDPEPPSVTPARPPDPFLLFFTLAGAAEAEEFYNCFSVIWFYAAQASKRDKPRGG